MEDENSPEYPNKRPKTPSSSPSPSPCGKGKAKMEDPTPEEDGGGADSAAAKAEERTCGICFTEEGRSIRGYIDSCDHYFCFVCIMEWAKIESRCPLCKQRFGSIRRPLVRGLFFCERVVHVPVRDQVHQLFYDATGDSDLYADTTCSVCHSSTDEYLLLLCDLCDSASHTYCAGLGYSVPEGDWYCHDCTILRDEHAKMQNGDDSSNEHFSRISSTAIEGSSPVSIFEIVRDETSSNSFYGSSVEVIRRENAETMVPDRGVVEGEPQDRAHIERNSQSNAPHSDERQSAHSFPEAKVTEFGARTLNQCRNLHLRIRILRENWSALQSGSKDFKSSLAASCSTSRNSKYSKRITSSVPGQQDCQPSADNQEVTVGSRVSSVVNGCTNSLDVDKAWKMLEIAQSMQSKRSCYEPPKPSGKKSICENKVQHKVLRSIPEHKSPGCSVSQKLPKDKTGIGSGKCFSCHSLEMVEGNFKLQNSEKQRPAKPVMEEIGQSGEGSSLSSVRQRKEGQGPLHGIYHASRSVTQKDVPAFSEPSNCVQVGAFSPSVGKTEVVADVGCNTLRPDKDSLLGRNADENSTRACDNAKNEIQSLVKLNLKLQHKGSHLGPEKFKEIARVATHTILAACGLDHSKHKAQPFPSTICRHSDQANLLRRSNLMPDACRECFYSFVKDVVDSVISEKTSVSNAS